jgi:hypothetical protein
MATSSQRGIALCAVIAALNILGFQNCARIPTPNDADTQSLASEGPAGGLEDTAKVSLIAPTNVVAEGQDIEVTVQFENVRDLSMHCRDKLTSELLTSQFISKSGDTVLLRVDRDISCYVGGSSIFDRHPVQAYNVFEVDCGVRTKNISTNRCE